MTEAELLFTEVLNCKRLSLYLNKDNLLSDDKAALISDTLRRRISGEPIQYILAKTEFMGLEFKVAPDVFIPRPETEILVETSLKYAKGLKNILDLGTGSGCIAISLAKNLAQAQIFASDISNKALSVAKENARLNKVDISFFQSDLLETIDYRLSTIDLIISNPPYVASEDIDKLQPEISYEPLIALDGGSDGLGFYRRVIKEAPNYLKAGGLLIMEMGFKQNSAINNIFENS